MKPWLASAFSPVQGPRLRKNHHQLTRIKASGTVMAGHSQIAGLRRDEPVNPGHVDALTLAEGSGLARLQVGVVVTFEQGTTILHRLHAHGTDGQGRRCRRHEKYEVDLHLVD